MNKKLLVFSFISLFLSLFSLEGMKKKAGYRLIPDEDPSEEVFKYVWLDSSGFYVNHREIDRNRIALSRNIQSGVRTPTIEASARELAFDIIKAKLFLIENGVSSHDRRVSDLDMKVEIVIGAINFVYNELNYNSVVGRIYLDSIDFCLKNNMKKALKYLVCVYSSLPYKIKGDKEGLNILKEIILSLIRAGISRKEFLILMGKVYIYRDLYSLKNSEVISILHDISLKPVKFALFKLYCKNSLSLSLDKLALKSLKIKI